MMGLKVVSALLCLSPEVCQYPVVMEVQFSLGCPHVHQRIQNGFYPVAGVGYSPPFGVLSCGQVGTTLTAVTWWFSSSQAGSWGKQVCGQRGSV